MDALHLENEEVQAANKQSKRFIWKTFTSISIAVCLVTVLRLATTQGPQRPGNSNRRLSAPNDLSENVSSPAYKSGNISEPIPAVNTLCICNPSATPVYLSIPLASRTLSSGWAWTNGRGPWNSRPCSCIPSEDFAVYATELQTLPCWYVVGLARPSQCEGFQPFYYSRYSGLAGRYVFSGSPPVYRDSSYCRPPFLFCR